MADAKEAVPLSKKQRAELLFTFRRHRKLYTKNWEEEEKDALREEFGMCDSDSCDDDDE